MKKTKIVCTLGPASNTKERIMDLAAAGMGAARINMSHTDRKTLVSLVREVQKANKELRFPVPIILDTKGVELRMESLEKPIDVKTGDTFEIRYGHAKDHVRKGACMNTNIFPALKPRMNIFIDDGTIEMEVQSVHKDRALCKVMTSGTVKSRKSINVPGLQMDLSGITKKEIEDISFAIKNGVRVFTLSFIRHASEVRRIRKLADRMRTYVFLIAKIEDAIGVENIDEILEVSDGIMVARGDLGAEVPLEEVPLLQKKIIDRCREKGKPVIVATQMMESMIENPVPTRAEVSDVATAVLQKADMVMLSAETSVGKYPVRCVQAMSRICNRMEAEEKFIMPMRGEDRRSIREEITLAASMLSRNMDAKAIIVFTMTGRLARLTAKHRPTSDIFAFTKFESVQHFNQLSRGVNSYVVKLSDHSRDNINNAVDSLKSDGYIKSGDVVVIISDVFKGHKESQMIEVKKVK
jgi:pyruvate kinase